MSCEIEFNSNSYILRLYMVWYGTSLFDITEKYTAIATTLNIMETYHLLTLPFKDNDNVVLSTSHYGEYAHYHVFQLQFHS